MRRVDANGYIVLYPATLIVIVPIDLLSLCEVRIDPAVAAEAPDLGGDRGLFRECFVTAISSS
jgi:hypothetical protein